MKTIIAGSRDVDISTSQITEELGNAQIVPTLIISGRARGVDRKGEDWAKENNVPILKMPADWQKYKKAAGPIRNTQMAEKGDALLCFWDGKSTGTKDMIECAKKKNLKIHIVYTEKDIDANFSNE